MNKNILIVLSVLMIALFAGAVSATADIVTDSTGNTVADKVTIDADYVNFVDEDQPIIQVHQTVFVKNTGSTPTDITVTATNLPTVSTGTGYTANTVTVANVGVGSTASFDLVINVPHLKAPGNVQIGTVTATPTGGVTDSVLLFQNTAEMLIVDKIKVKYEDPKGKSQSDDFDAETDDSFSLGDDTRPGSEIKFSIKVSSLFDDDSYRPSEIKDVKVTVDADDSDIFEDDFDDEYDFNDLKAGDDDTVDIAWTIPSDIDEDDYTVQFTVEGKDRKLVKYKFVKEVTVSVSRENDDVRIAEAKVSPTTVTTCDNSFALNVRLENIGSDSQDQVTFAVFNSELGIDENVFPIEMDEYDGDQNYWEKTFTFNLPKKVAAKTYALDLRAYINTDKSIDNDVVNVPIKDCAGEEVATQPTTPSVITTTINTSGQPGSNGMTGGTTGTSPTGSSDVIETTEVPTSNNLFIALIVVGGVLVLALIGLFVAILLK